MKKMVKRLEIARTVASTALIRTQTADGGYRHPGDLDRIE